VGFPPGTVELPSARSDLAAEVAAAELDPDGCRETLVRALRDEPVATGHLATTAWVLDAAARQALLVRHRVLGWVVPGGHLEVDEPPAVGARRELAEETGLTLAPVIDRIALLHAAAIPARGSDPPHWHWNLGYLFVADPAAPVWGEPGAPVRWFARSGLPDDAVPDLVANLERAAGLLARIQRSA
jgi:8-oxo-dGTP pyrophosphatase MutT (NUDIX family)